MTNSLFGRWLTISCVFACGVTNVPNAHGQDPVAGVLDVGSGLELAIDPPWMAETKGLRLEQKSPVPREVVMRGRGEFGYLSVLKDGSVYRMYHRTVIPSRDPDGLEFFCYLESKDAVKWVRPELNLFKIPGLDFPNAITRENKANPDDVDSSHTPCISHNMRPFLDTRPGVPKSERFKALAGGFKGGQFAWTLEIDLGKPQTASRVRILFASGYPTDYGVAVSADGKKWTEVHRGKGASHGRYEHTFTPTSVRYVLALSYKPDGRGQEGGQMCVAELEVYEK